MSPYQKSLEELRQMPGLGQILSGNPIRGASGGLKEITSFSTLNNLLVLKNLCAHLQPQTSLEIGMAFGGSTLLLAELYRRRQVPAARQHVAIDPFQNQPDHWDGVALKLLQETGLREYVEHREDRSCQALPQMMKEGKKFDLIYIDGSHLFEDVFVDYYFCQRLLRPNGLLLFDDCTDPHVAKVIRFIRRNGATTLQEKDLLPFRPGTHALRYRLARRLGKLQLRGFSKIGEDERRWNAPLVPF